MTTKTEFKTSALKNYNDEKRNNFYVRYGVYLTVLLIIFITSLFFIMEVDAANIVITPINVSDNYIHWKWDSVNLTRLSVDGNLISGFDNRTNDYILQNLNPKSKHIITVENLTSSGSNTTYTTDKTDGLTNIYTIISYWLIPLILPMICWIVAIYLEIPFIAYIGALFSCFGIIGGLTTGFIYLTISGLSLIVSLFIGFGVEK